MGKGENSRDQIMRLTGDASLELLSILSPSRTISTSLSRSIAAHPAVDGEVLQPFHMQKEPAATTDMEDRAFTIILNVFEALHKGGGKKPIIIVSKEMARNLVDPQAFNDWDKAAKAHLLTIRNPLLSIESTLRLYLNFIEEKPEGLKNTAAQFAKAHGLEATPEFLQAFPNIYAKDKGFTDMSGLGQHWKVLAENVRQTRDYTVIAPLLEEFFPFYDFHSRLDTVKRGYAVNLRNYTAKQAGYESLDSFAQGKGYKNWNGLKKTLQQEGSDLTVVEPLLKEVFATSNTGWESFSNLLTRLGKSPRVKTVEGTLLRADPVATLQAICQHYGLDEKHLDAMISWKGALTRTETAHIETEFKSAFARVNTSSQLESPVESPLTTSHLPPRFKQHIFDTALPTYLQALGESHTIRPHGNALLQILDETLKNGKTLQQTDPVLAYALISTDKTIPAPARRKLLAAIKNTDQSLYGDMFAAIDTHCKTFTLEHFKSAPLGNEMTQRGLTR